MLRYGGRFVGVISVGLLLAGTVASHPERGIDVVFEDVPLATAVARLAALSNTTITLDGVAAEHRVSLLLQQATLAESLDQVFADQSHVIIWHSDGGVTIVMLGPGEALPGAGMGLANNVALTTMGMLPDQPEVLAVLDQPGITAADLAFDRSKLTPIDANAVEVIPPEAGAERGVSVAEFQSLLSQRGTVPTADMEIMPPESGMTRGITLAEFEALRPPPRNLPATEIEILPPDEPGGQGLTLAELKQSLQPDRAPRSLSSELTPN